MGQVVEPEDQYVRTADLPIFGHWLLWSLLAHISLVSVVLKSGQMLVFGGEMNVAAFGQLH
ncbi:MAG: hypothetical protein ACRCYS_13765, partial [Beijerinckiaceae bacterium]